MKKVLGSILLVFILCTSSYSQDECITIKEGILLNLLGEPIPMGFDELGYNYQAGIFNGDPCDIGDPVICDYFTNGDQITGVRFENVRIKMSWNKAFLSNQDCDNDGYLDRHYGFESYFDSDAELRVSVQALFYPDGHYDKREQFMFNWTLIALPESACWGIGHYKRLGEHHQCRGCVIEEYNGSGICGTGICMLVHTFGDACEFVAPVNQAIKRCSGPYSHFCYDEEWPSPGRRAILPREPSGYIYWDPWCGIRGCE